MISQPLQIPIYNDRRPRTNRRPGPIDPMMLSKHPTDHRRPKAPRRVQARACIIDAGDFRDKEREPDADGRDEGCAGLFGGEHEHGQEELDGEDGFEEEGLPVFDTGGWSGIDEGDGDVEEGFGQEGGQDSADELCREQD